VVGSEDGVVPYSAWPHRVKATPTNQAQGKSLVDGLVGGQTYVILR